MDRFRALVEKATSPNLPAGHEDIALNLDVCDAVRSRQVQPAQAMTVLRSRLEHDNPIVQLLALGLTDLCVKNGGTAFFAQIASRDYMDRVAELLSPPDNLNFDVRDKLLRCVVDWACFEESQEMPKVIGDTKRRLAGLGVDFPEPNPYAVAAARAFTETLVAPEWTDGPVCTRCRSDFTTFLRKHHCRNCGRVFCYRCSSKTASLPWYGIGQDVRVCDGCYSRRGPHEIATSKHLPPRPNKEQSDIERAIALSLQTAQPPPKPEEEDDPDLALAIAASLRDMHIAEEQRKQQQQQQQQQQTPYAQPSLSQAPYQTQFSHVQTPQAPQPAPFASTSAAPAQRAPPVPPRPPLELDARDVDNVLTFAQTITEDSPWKASGEVPKPVENMYERAAASRITLARTLDQGNKRLHALSSMHDKLSEAVRLYDRLLDAQMDNVASIYSRPAPHTAPAPAPALAPAPAPAAPSMQPSSVLQSAPPQPKREPTALDLLSEMPSAPPVAQTTLSPSAPQAASAPQIQASMPAPSAPRLPPATSAEPAASGPSAPGVPQQNATTHSSDTTIMPQLPSAPSMPVMPNAPTRPVGCLAALGLAERGFKVMIYEARGVDSFSSRAGASLRSINLAISVRGLTAIEAISPGNSAENGMSARILSDALPMTARMIHINDNGKTTLQRQQYSLSNEAIYSFDRARLNRLLLDRAVLHPNINVAFEHKLVSSAFTDEGVTLKLEVAGNLHTKSAALLVGCDGMHSAARQSIAPIARMNTSTEYIDTEYIELHIPPVDGPKKWAIDKDCLHIWPKHDFMLIALPNIDGSFTSTLFGPHTMYEKFATRESAAEFFRTNFPDALEVMREEDVISHLTERRPNALGFVRCSPMHYRASAVLLGDAAHAMVPFYGQGLNCGLEDVRIFIENLDKAIAQTSNLREALVIALPQYSAKRQADVAAIQKLALDNYVEMRSKVVSPSYLARKWLDGKLVRILPHGYWRTLYSMVTFSNIGYATALFLW
ncbi:kynurenine 3-monooxygenase [Malassezia cuniculi]|uniref:Vacuolar protein sorting-associated protein 27 n=1 Tax=Malassezia cuniculi TaxID=948313 RepID=A0AAF0ESP4_9BASI|nr:kynurenine 3-monooxygenase [Malassezia cuniculi]